tara:strand:+ start:6466 stop:7167 length:702 start_codon:yes stop_codon:yes gene_type:complete
MALPVLEATRYTCELPVSKKKVEYRPFLVKEQKLLLVAGESEEQSQITNGMLDLLQNCVFNTDEVQLREIPIMDLEYLFIQVRMKSAGETVKVGLGCDKCEESTEVEVDLRKSAMNGELPINTIKLTEQIGIKLTFPSLKTMPEEETSTTESIFDMIAGCIDQVYSGDEVFTRDDFTTKELKEFLDQFTSEQFELLNNYFMEMPRYCQTINWTCVGCGVDNQRELQGIADFFA